MKKLTLSLLGASLLVAGTTAYLISEEIKSQHILLNAERISSIACAFCDVYLYSNGLKIGTLGNGETKHFWLKPSFDGQFEIEARLIRTIGSNGTPISRKVSVNAGQILHATWEINPWVMKLMAEESFRIVLENRPQPITKLLPTTIGAAASTTVATFSDSQIKIPWDAIGAIASILGAIAGFAALFRQ